MKKDKIESEGARRAGDSAALAGNILCERDGGALRAGDSPSGAGIATVTLFYAITRWNGYYWSRILIANSFEQPLQVYLRQLIENYQKLYDESSVVLDYSADSLAYAIIVCSIIPVMVVYPFIQKYFTRGVNLGGIKG